MKIERKNTDNILCFRDVNPGVVLKDSEGVIYMKLDWKYGNATTSRNAVVLEIGCLVFFCEDEEVEILPDAVLTY